jgi:hypothetical protein
MQKGLLCPRAVVCRLVLRVLGAGRKHAAAAARARERRFGVYSALSLNPWNFIQLMCAGVILVQFCDNECQEKESFFAHCCFFLLLCSNPSTSLHAGTTVQK